MSDPKPFTWSHSSLKNFETCPRQYHATKVLKLYPYEESAAAKYGNEVHKAIELYALGQAPFPPVHAKFKPAVDAVLAKPGRKLPEHRMGVTRDLQPCEFFAKDVWVRGVADLLVVDDDDMRAWVVDWKTGGNKYPDLDQLKLMALMVFTHFPHIRKVSAALLFLVPGTMNKTTVTREEFEDGWWRYRERTSKIEAAMAHDVWNPKPSGLCKKHCPHTPCEFNGRH